MIKINRRGKRQNRVLGVDGYNIYNYKAKKTADGGTETKKKSSFFGGFLSKKLFNVKRKIRPISSITEIKKLDIKTFSILFSDSKDKKAIIYEC